MVVLLREATLPWVGPVVRELSPEPPWSDDDARVLRVCLTASELSQVDVGSRVLLRIRPQDATWLNLYRPVVVDRELRLILWADAEATDVLQREAVDFFSWIVRVIEVPEATLPEFAVERLRAALETGREIAWRGPMLNETLRAAGWGAGVVELSATMDYERMLAALKQPGLPVVAQVGSQRDVWRVRFALAHSGRPATWVALDPADDCVDSSQLGVHQLDWDQATAMLADAGRSHPALQAAWLNLEPAMVEAQSKHPPRKARERTSADDWLAELEHRLRELNSDPPSYDLIEAFAIAGFNDIFQYFMGPALPLPPRIERSQTSQTNEQVREWEKTAELLMQRGEFEQAHRCLETALDGTRRLLAHEPERIDLRRSLAKLLERLGDVHLMLGVSDSAHREYEEALMIRHDLVDRAPDSVELRRELGASFERLGILNLAIADLAGAQTAFENDLRIADDLVTRAPDRVDLREDLATALEHASLDPERARDYLERAVALSREIHSSDPDDLAAACMLGIRLARLSMVLAVAGEDSLAHSSAREAMALLHGLEDRRARQWLDILAQHLGQSLDVQQLS